MCFVVVLYCVGRFSTWAWWRGYLSCKTDGTCQIAETISDYYQTISTDAAWCWLSSEAFHPFEISASPCDCCSASDFGLPGKSLCAKLWPVTAAITLLSYGCREWPSIYLPAPFKVFSSTGFVLHISNKDMFYTPSLYARSGRWKMKYDCGMMNSVFSLHTKQMILMWLNNVKQCQTMLKTQ